MSVTAPSTVIAAEATPQVPKMSTIEAAQNMLLSAPSANSRHLSERKHCIRCPCCPTKSEVHRASWNLHCKTKAHQDMIATLKKVGMEVKVDWLTMNVFKCSVSNDLSHLSQPSTMKRSPKKTKTPFVKSSRLPRDKSKAQSKTALNFGFTALSITPEAQPVAVAEV